MTRITSKLARRTTLALSGWLLAACSTDRMPTSIDQTPALAPASANRGLVTDLLGAPVAGVGTVITQVLTLERLIPLPGPVSASAAFGATGGSVSIPPRGVTLVVPAGAVSSSTEFRITAVPGATVAHEFEPHGTIFEKPLVLQQRLGPTS
jgi:hypothetical protein